MQDAGIDEPRGTGRWSDQPEDILEQIDLPRLVIRNELLQRGDGVDRFRRGLASLVVEIGQIPERGGILPGAFQSVRNGLRLLRRLRHHHGGRLVRLQHRVDMAVPVSGAVLEAFAAAEVAEIVVDGLPRETDQADHRESREREGSDGGRPRISREEARIRRRYPADDSRAAPLAQGAYPLGYRDERRHQQIGRDPADEHAGEAHEPELVEPAEAHRRE